MENDTTISTLSNAFEEPASEENRSLNCKSVDALDVICAAQRLELIVRQRLN